MKNMIVLVDYKTSDGRIEGVAMDMGNDLALIASQLSILERSPPPEREFDKAYVMTLHDKQPSEYYVPDNMFGKQACGLDGSAQLPMGKRWFKLVMRINSDGLSSLGLSEEE